MYLRVEKIGPETFPTACTWHLQRIYVTKKFGPEVYPRACTAYIRKKMWFRLTLPPVHGLHSLYT
jgi:hypothetical protein